MVLNIRLLHIHKRSCKIFGCLEDQPFVDLSIIAVDDLLLLPLIQSPHFQIFEKYNSTFADFFNLWSLFLMEQLTGVIRQIKWKKLRRPS